MVYLGQDELVDLLNRRIGKGITSQRVHLVKDVEQSPYLSLLFNIHFGLSEANVDNLGHLGGLIVGIIMGFAIAENDDRNDRS